MAAGRLLGRRLLLGRGQEAAAAAAVGEGRRQTGSAAAGGPVPTDLAEVPDPKGSVAVEVGLVRTGSAGPVEPIDSGQGVEGVSAGQVEPGLGRPLLGSVETLVRLEVRPHVRTGRLRGSLLGRLCRRSLLRGLFGSQPPGLVSNGFCCCCCWGWAGAWPNRLAWPCGLAEKLAGHMLLPWAGC